MGLRGLLIVITLRCRHICCLWTTSSLSRVLQFLGLSLDTILGWSASSSLCWRFSIVSNFLGSRSGFLDFLYFSLGWSPTSSSLGSLFFGCWCCLAFSSLRHSVSMW
uniref:Uncharacterized protein n=1 Tax=Cacopsylla melanoneura TaxID=428564 RepID=A0A8D8WYB5_9HEMI